MKKVLDWLLGKKDPLQDKEINLLMQRITHYENKIVELAGLTEKIKDPELFERMREQAKNWNNMLKLRKYFLFMRYRELGGDVYEPNNDLPHGNIGNTIFGFSDADMVYFEERALLDNLGVDTGYNYWLYKKIERNENSSNN